MRKLYYIVSLRDGEIVGHVGYNDLFEGVPCRLANAEELVAMDTFSHLPLGIPHDRALVFDRRVHARAAQQALTDSPGKALRWSIRAVGEFKRKVNKALKGWEVKFSYGYLSPASSSANHPSSDIVGERVAHDNDEGYIFKRRADARAAANKLGTCYFVEPIFHA